MCSCVCLAAQMTLLDYENIGVCQDFLVLKFWTNTFEALFSDLTHPFVFQSKFLVQYFQIQQCTHWLNIILNQKLSFKQIQPSFPNWNTLGWLQTVLCYFLSVLLFQMHKKTFLQPAFWKGKYVTWKKPKCRIFKVQQELCWYLLKSESFWINSMILKHNLSYFFFFYKYSAVFQW